MNEEINTTEENKPKSKKKYLYIAIALIFLSLVAYVYNTSKSVTLVTSNTVDSTQVIADTLKKDSIVKKDSICIKKDTAKVVAKKETAPKSKK